MHRDRTCESDRRSVRYRSVFLLGSRGAKCWCVLIALLCLLATDALAHLDEPPPVGCTPSAFLVYGGRTNGCRTTTPGENILAQFEGAPGDVVRVIFVAPGYFDPRIVVRAPDGATIAEQACDGGAFPSVTPACVIEMDLPPLSFPATDIYDIEVSDDGADEIGSYLMQLERIPPTCEEPACGFCDDDGICWTKAALVQQDNDYLDFQPLSVRTDVDHVVIEAVASERILVEVWTVVVDFFAPRLEIFDPTSSRIAEVVCPRGAPNDVTCASVEFDVEDAECTAQAPCIFSASVSDDEHEFGSTSGGFVLKLTRLPEPGAHLLGATSLAVLGLLARRRG